MKVAMFLVLLLTSILATKVVYAQVIALDCQDNPSQDPSICRENLDCSNQMYSVCSVCIHSGAVEVCKDNADNNCNQDESDALDDNPNTGLDRKDISCCDISWWNWVNVNNEVIENAVANQQVFLSVRGTQACSGKSAGFDVFEQDPCFNPFGSSSCGRDEVAPDPNPAVFDINGFARTPWTVVYVEDEFASFGNDPEYRFNITIFDGMDIYFEEESAELHVGRAKDCEIKDVLFGASCSANGKDVVVTVIGNEGCDGKTAGLELYEYETAFEQVLLKFPDDHFYSTEEDNFPVAQPGSVNFVGNRAIKQMRIEYHSGNDDGENKDLEYRVLASVNANKQENSEVLKVRQCNNAADSDCDGILDARDLCINTPVCSEVDNDGCTNGQQSCLAEWDCNEVEWSECDEDTGLKTRDIGDCSDVINNPEVCNCRYLGTNPLCQTEFIPISSISCIEEEEFPFFTAQNIIITILILLFYYFVLFRKNKKKKIRYKHKKSVKKRKRLKKYKKARSS